jgi:NACalpha-BTF3-like transcription factor
MSRIGAIRPKESEVVAKQQALAKIAIKKEDIELIVSGKTEKDNERDKLELIIFNIYSFEQMKELEVSKAEADLKLREHDGNLVEALIALTN